MRLRRIVNRLLIGIAVWFVIIGAIFLYVTWSGEGTRSLKQQKSYIENVEETFQDTLSKEELKVVKKELRMITVKIIFTYVLSVLVMIGSIGILILIIKFTKKCPKCKKLSAFEKTGKRLYGEPKEIWMKVETNERSAYDGEIISKHEQYITGERRTYQIVYRCKYCGYEDYIYRTADTPNT